MNHIHLEVNQILKTRDYVGYVITIKLCKKQQPDLVRFHFTADTLKTKKELEPNRTSCRSFF